MKAQVAGMGWVTALGREIEGVWQAVKAGHRPEIEWQESVSGGRAVPVLRVPRELVSEEASIPRLRRSSAISHFAVAASADAAAAAGLGADELARTALVFAASDGGVVYTGRFYAGIVERGEGAGSPLLFPETVYNAPASHIAARLGLSGECLTLVGDGAAGIAAISTGCELLACGEADYCVVAAAQEIDWVTCEAYGRWNLTGAASGAPFSEGAAALVLAKRGKFGCVEAIHPGFSYRTREQAGARLEETIRSLEPAGSVALAVSCQSGSGLDAIEEACLARAVPKAQTFAPRMVLGESLACGTLQQVIAGLLAMDDGGAERALVTVLGFNGQLAGLTLTHSEKVTNRL